METRKKSKPTSQAKSVEAKAPAVRARKSPEPGQPAGIKKLYHKTMPLCKVTFTLPGVAAPAAQHVSIVGDFNNWSITQDPMKKSVRGDFTISLDLETGREYQFRYLIDETRWENDWYADKYVATVYGDSENSVVIV